MRIFTGRPRNRMGYGIEDWAQVSQSPTGRHYERRLPVGVHLEVTRIWGLGIGNWFVGVQRVALAPEIFPTDGTDGTTNKGQAPHPSPEQKGSEQ